MRIIRYRETDTGRTRRGDMGGGNAEVMMWVDAVGSRGDKEWRNGSSCC